MSYIITTISAVFVFGLVIFIHEFGHFTTAKKNGITVNEFSIGMGPLLWSKQGKETLYSIRLLPIGGFCAMEGEDEDSDKPGSFSTASVPARLAVVAAGARNNIILGVAVLCLLTIFGGNIASTVVAGFYDDSLTHETGLMENDRIVSVNGSRLFIANDLFYEMLWVKDGKCDMTVIRDGEKTVLKDVTFNTVENDDGTNTIQLDFYVYAEPKNPVTIFKHVILWTLSLTRQILRGLYQLITGVVPLNQLSGPVGIVSAIGEAAGLGLDSLLLILAYISINLGLMNILPLPALDGGKIVGLIIEGISGKKPSQKMEIAINVAGFVLLISIMIFATYNDILRLFK